METIINLSSLKDIYKNDHKTAGVRPVLPFTVNNPREFGDQFENILGNFVRNITLLQVKTKKREIEILNEDDPLINEIKNSIKCNEEDQIEMEIFLKSYLYRKENGVKINHPFLYNYLNGDEGKTSQKNSKFMVDIFVGENEKIREMFTDKTTENIIDELILSKLPVKYEEIPFKLEYQSLFPKVDQLFTEDLLYLRDHKEYFLQSFYLFLRFYVFNYCCQVLIKFETKFNADYSAYTPLYYVLDMELGVSKRRPAASDSEGYKRIKDSFKNLFVHMHTQFQLCRYGLDNKEEIYDFKTYVMIENEYENWNETEQKNYLDSLYEWNQTYCGLYNIEFNELLAKSDLRGRVNYLYECIEKGVNSGAASKYGGHIEPLGGSEFLKARGRTGKVLNLSYEMILLLTAISVKNERIPLNQLFKEYEKRGVHLDRYSKKCVVDLLDGLNYIDKKSDSGDAQYVKPIL